MRKELKAALDLARTLDAADLPFFVGELETIRCIALMRLCTREIKSQTDELLTVSEAARRMAVSKDFIYRNHRKFSFVRREGSRLLFSSNGLDSYLKKSR